MKFIFFVGLSFLLLFQSELVTAQMRTNVAERIKEVKTRKIWLMSHKPGDNVIKKLQKTNPGQVEEYKKFIEDYHKMLMEVFKANWPYTQDVSFKDKEELFQAEKKGGGKDYAEIRFLYGEADRGLASYFNEYGMVWPIDSGKFVIKHELADRKSIVVVELRLADEAGYQALYTLALPHKIPTRSDLTFLFQYLVWYIDHPVLDGVPYKAAEKSSLIKAKLVPNSKLLVNESDLEETFDTSTFKVHYKFPYEIVSTAEYDSIITNKVNGYAYLIISPIVFDQYINYNPVIVSTNGEPLAFIKTTTNSQLGSNFTGYQGYSKVNAKLLDVISEEINDSKRRK
ncbi:MAG TPA: hypothetical protein PLD02_10265 [Saprospiraceae bacterium]|nr:hypothetical protein [Saprospiraceae bacterium]